MKIYIDYGTQMRTSALVTNESVEIGNTATLYDLLSQLIVSKKTGFAESLFSGERQLRPGVMVFVNDDSVPHPETHLLRDGDRISILTLVSGG